MKAYSVFSLSFSFLSDDDKEASSFADFSSPSGIDDGGSLLSLFALKTVLEIVS